MAQQQLLAEESQQQEAAEVGAELEGWQGKVDYYEKRYHKITSATGLTQPEDIVNKFYFNDDITADLNKEIAERKTHIVAMEQERDDGLEELSSHKEKFVASKWKDVEQVQGIFEVKDKRSRRDKFNLASLLKNVATVFEGLMSLSANIEDSVGPHPSPQFLEAPSSEDLTSTATYWCGRLEEELSHAMEVSEEVRERVQLQEEAQHKEEEEEEDLMEKASQLKAFAHLSKAKPVAEEAAAEYSDDEYQDDHEEMEPPK
jgi:hypothetical protein